jgi:YbbR domain-containing protein
VNRAGETLTNAATFLLALVLAFFIWMSASETQDPIRTRFLEVPLQYVGLPADTTLVDVDARQTVQIRLEGPDTILQEITPDDFVATADLSQVPSGERVSVEINVTTTTPGAEISFITPEQVDVMLEQQVTRDIPVELDIRGSVARGHTQGEPLVEPPSIRVSGPESQVNQLNFALVTIFLNSTVETLIETSSPIFYDQAGRVSSVSVLDLSHDDVTVTVPVEESAGFADKLVTVVWTGEPAPGYRLLSVTADPPSVLVEGRPAQVNLLASVTTEPIDIDGLTETFQQAAVLALPTGISVDPEQTVTVNIEIEPILTTSSYNRVPDPRGLRSGYEAIIEPEQVRVVLFGPLPVLDALSEDDVRVILDLFGLEPGRYSIVPDVDIPDRGIEIRSVQPSAVTVTISEAVTNLENPPDEQIVSTNAITPTIMSTTPPRSVRIPAICYLVPSSTISTGLQEICMGRRESE